MYVRWQRQKLKSGLNGTSINLVALLVGNYRKKGQPQEKCLEELGTIKEHFLTTKAKDTRAFHQGLFWVVVDKKLDHLGLNPVVRKRIEAEILETVPRPNDDWALWAVTCIPQYDPKK
ncbi:MAG: hypothetical protein JSV31_01250 [Desulfobacterales bacterium]|nr:MAG: hypothetical protein JSV31_01250 [Desulfobacterales bacterium]